MITRLRKIRPAAFIAGFLAAIVLTGGGTAAYAANGGSLLIGRSNSGSSLTTLTNSGGIALKLNSKSGTAPLAVQRTNKVTNLNADLLDGVTEGSLARAAGKTGVIFADGEWWDTDGDLINDALFAFAECPPGTKMTGGGLDNYTGETPIFDSPGFDGISWEAATWADESINANDDLRAYVVCYNPRGAVPGADISGVNALRATSPESRIQQRLSELHAKQ